MNRLDRRDFLLQSLAAGAAAWAAPAALAEEAKDVQGMRLGLVTYLWGESWDLPTVIANCEKAKILGVELRTEHKHGVEPRLSAAERAEVKKRFADSAVTFVGPGTNECYDSPDAARLTKSIETTKAFIKLSHDCGGSGVKVKPNDFHKEVPHDKTIAQIAESLNTIGKFAADYGQEIRLEVHGSCGAVPVIKQIMDQVEAKNVGACWNCNGDELKSGGLAQNFNLLRPRFGHTAHVRELNLDDYPYGELIGLFVRSKYAGWILLECRTKPADVLAALSEQREVFLRMLG